MPLTVTVSDLRSPDGHLRDASISDLERETRNDPSALEEFRPDLLELANADEPWPIRLHVVRMLGRLEWIGSDHQRVLAFLFAEAEGRNRFVSAWALDALANLSLTAPSIRERVFGLIETGLGSPSAAVRVRAREALKRLADPLHNGSANL